MVPRQQNVEGARKKRDRFPFGYGNGCFTEDISDRLKFRLLPFDMDILNRTGPLNGSERFGSSDLHTLIITENGAFV